MGRAPVPPAAAAVDGDGRAPDPLGYTDASGRAAVVADLPGWVAFAQPRFVAEGPSRSTYAKLAATVQAYDGQPLAPPFTYPPFLAPAPPATATLAQLDYFASFPVMLTNPVTNAPVLAGFAFAVSDGPYQGREHWVLGAHGPGAVVVGSNGAPTSLSAFAGQMNAPAWQPGSTFVTASVRYYPYLAE